MQKIEDLKKVIVDLNFSELQKALKDYNIEEHDKFGNNILYYYLNFLNNNGLTKNDFKEVINEFLKRGLDINEKQISGAFQRTPLQLSVVLNLREVFDFLLEKGADVIATDANGNSILSNAVFYYNKDNESYGHYISALLRNNADPTIENEHGVSALSLSQSIANSDVGKYFG
ncbi:ankyrin repeat domain-containing protein [Chryseobacterium sp. BIGb0232]|uniref:ankyrin repeat domain-containing protein n=1 Tax=Chryseobacterium sp. BIGb0232 TaxID=2940598 RepID=UPI000F4A2C92|nr:ankyrin repeat domain-containing protein [Chryseobacterium sp. BIGb0232]MCS4304101.1 ankyrin repeat protein [Chryseobacterium sp. BIGb0232]ROS17680.1 hypothetical protein EDF65_2061 [Chryseobacterium nakagawai]